MLCTLMFGLVYLCSDRKFQNHFRSSDTTDNFLGQFSDADETIQSVKYDPQSAQKAFGTAVTRW